MYDQEQVRAWLSRLVGDWTLEFATADSSEYPGFTATGTEKVRTIGSGIVLESSSKGSDGSQSRSITLISGDAAPGRVTGAVLSTAVESVFSYQGSISDDGTTLTLETEGPAMTPGRKTDRYRDLFVIEDDIARFTAAELLHDDGSWREFMRTNYRRAAG